MLLPLEEYPTLPDMPDTTGTIGADAFASAIHQVAIAAGKDDTLPALTGIRMEINEDTLTMVATDRYRLAVRELRWTPVAPGLNTAVLVLTAVAVAGGFAYRAVEDYAAIVRSIDAKPIEGRATRQTLVQPPVMSSPYLNVISDGCGSVATRAEWLGKPGPLAGWALSW